jgi:hypothetical protein
LRVESNTSELSRREGAATGDVLELVQDVLEALWLAGRDCHRVGKLREQEARPYNQAVGHNDPHVMIAARIAQIRVAATSACKPEFRFQPDV